MSDKEWIKTDMSQPVVFHPVIPGSEAPSKPLLTVSPPPQEWLDIHNIGRFRKPNAWHRFWAWFLLGWRWDENLWRSGEGRRRRERGA